MASITFRVEERLRQRFERLVAVLGLNRSHVLREALAAKIGELETLARHKQQLAARISKTPSSPEDAVRERLLTLPDVAQAIAFGSRAQGDADERSDLDLALSCPGITGGRWLEIVEAVEEAKTLVRLDLVWLEEAPATLKEEILRTGKVLYERSQT
jgi:predicted nucleotidyltransferase